MFRHILQKLSGMIGELRQRLQQSPGNAAAKSAPKMAPAKIARTNGHIKRRPHRKSPVRAVKKR